MSNSENDALAADLNQSVESAALVKYPSNVLEGFGAGCLMDFRLRLAIEIIKLHPMCGDELQPNESQAGMTARYSLKLATELMSQAATLGLIDPLPDDNGDLTPELRAQAKRTASFQALQQIEGQRFVADEQSRVVPQAPSVLNPGRRGH